MPRSVSKTDVNKRKRAGSYVHDVQDSGMALMESMNTFEDDKHRIRLSPPSAAPGTGSTATPSPPAEPL